MTTEELEELFQKHDEEFLKFERIPQITTQRKDLHAFLLLDKLVPFPADIVSCAEHDEIFLSVRLEELAAVINEEQVIELIRCGIRTDGDSLSMFV